MLEFSNKEMPATQRYPPRDDVGQSSMLDLAAAVAVLTANIISGVKMP